ncbi:MAG: cytochrome c biogenesis protein [Bryobacteraceae bacterium]
MREKLTYLIAAAVAVLLVANLYNILLVLPDEANQGAIWRIFTFHFPSAMTAGLCSFLALIGSIMYLWKRNLWWDAFAVSATELTLAFGAVVLITGMIWARVIWGIWWAWDARLTSTLVSWLAYAAYLIFRNAIEEPTARARYSAVISLFTFPGVIISWKSIEWWRTQHPGPVLTIRGGGGMAPGMQPAAYWNLLALAVFAMILLSIRLRQENTQRLIDGFRRQAHEI